MLEWKQLYNDIKNEGLEGEGVESQQEELLDVLSVTNFLRPALTTLIIMCDASNSALFNKAKAKKDERFNNEMRDYLIREHGDGHSVLMLMFGVQK
jgi:hypothetical protein